MENYHKIALLGSFILVLILYIYEVLIKKENAPALVVLVGINALLNILPLILNK